MMMNEANRLQSCVAKDLIERARTMALPIESTQGKTGD